MKLRSRLMIEDRFNSGYSDAILFFVYTLLMSSCNN